jgi:hypothetical protein
MLMCYNNISNYHFEVDIISKVGEKQKSEGKG